MNARVFLCAFFFTASLPAQPLRYEIEANHSTVGFSIPIFGGLTRVTGKFSDPKVIIVYDEENLKASSVEVSLPVASVDTGIDMRDKDLQSEVFFFASQHAEILFQSNEIQKTEDGMLARGRLTMRGVSRGINLPFTLKVHQFEDGGKILAISSRLTLNRIDFGVGAEWRHTAMENFLGHQVDVEIDLWTRSGKRIEEG